MYARDLMIWLHERLAERGTLDETKVRFERLRGYGLLPRGRESAGERLTDEQIANAVLGFTHPLPGFAGHASLVLGDLRPVGGASASIGCAKSLRGAIAALIAERRAYSELVRLTLTVEQDFKGDEYAACVRFDSGGERRCTSFVSKYALTLSQAGAEIGYDHDRLKSMSAVERVFGPTFFRDLADIVHWSRELNRPLKTDWREYESEEEKAALHKRLGARRSSRFLNLRVDASVTWPKEPTRMEFAGHHLVLFPRTKEHSHSISIDLAAERLSDDGARSLINRLLSIMSWCDDQPASLHDGWSGNPIPVPIPRDDRGLMVMTPWMFRRSLPTDEKLLQCLAYYRDGLNAHSVGLSSHAVVSFYKVIETRYYESDRFVKWVDRMYGKEVSLDDRFEADRATQSALPGAYIHSYCRIATAHASRKFPSDPDGSEEARRLNNASEVLRRLARHFISTRYGLSTSYLSDKI